MATHFNLVPYIGFVWKQSFINCTTRCATYGTPNVDSQNVLKNNLLLQWVLKVHWGCIKADSLRTRWYFLSKTKTCRNIIDVFSLLCYMFYFTVFMKKVFQNSWRNTTPINTVPYINFSVCTKESLHDPGR